MTIKKLMWEIFILYKIWTFDQNFDFCYQFYFIFTNILIFVTNFILFLPKFWFFYQLIFYRFLIKISIIDKNFDFWSKFWFLTKFQLLTKIPPCLPKSRFSFQNLNVFSKISILTKQFVTQKFRFWLKV